MGKRYERNLIILEINNWTKCTQDRVKWKEVVEKARTFKQWICSARRRRTTTTLEQF
jgi:hypothetical protein